MSDPVERWQRVLDERIGMGKVERDTLRSELDEFCAARGTDPATLVGTWQEHPELTVRRRPGATEAPNLAVESFLIHNGIMVFGDLVCVPGARQEDLADQGARFTREGRAGRA